MYRLLIKSWDPTGNCEVEMHSGGEGRSCSNRLVPDSESCSKGALGSTLYGGHQPTFLLRIPSLSLKCFLNPTHSQADHKSLNTNSCILQNILVFSLFPVSHVSVLLLSPSCRLFKHFKNSIDLFIVF